MRQSPGEGPVEALDDLGFLLTRLHAYLWQVWDRAQVEGLEDATEALDSLGFANTLLKPYLWQVWDRAQVEGLENVEEAPNDLGVVAGHGRFPQVAHQCVDRDCGVVILTACHQSCCGEQVPSILSVSSYSSCSHQNIEFMVIAGCSPPNVSFRHMWYVELALVLLQVTAPLHTVCFLLLLLQAAHHSVKATAYTHSVASYQLLGQS